MCKTEFQKILFTKAGRGLHLAQVHSFWTPALATQNSVSCTKKKLILSSGYYSMAVLWVLNIREGMIDVL